MHVPFSSCLSLPRCLLLRPLNSPPRFTFVLHAVQGRNYAKKAQSTSSLKPGSQQPLTKPADLVEHEKCEEKMKASIECFRRDCTDSSTRAAGRVTPALLANVRVKEQKLEEVATVGVRDGSMLVVTVLDVKNLKHVEGTMHDTKIPSFTPQRQDTRTLRIPVPKPMLDAKSSRATFCLWNARLIFDLPAVPVSLSLCRSHSSPRSFHVSSLSPIATATRCPQRRAFSIGTHPPSDLFEYTSGRWM
ncbi:hypothetical protein EDD18DRAFT_1290211 [Armillaria luteobubalina]|uniref:Ribosome recycling factor domain-containing protein n=1 Tax=Armillaria luteobubalina TaxID=153913 RepID=A0AA39PXQ8_9AGAR|nr:hypothetical protein EDD18DRAFT_1290211 [Armillaria luteobubalina]